MLKRSMGGLRRQRYDDWLLESWEYERRPHVRHYLRKAEHVTPNTLERYLKGDLFLRRKVRRRLESLSWAIYGKRHTQVRQAQDWSTRRKIGRLVDRVLCGKNKMARKEVLKKVAASKARKGRGSLLKWRRVKSTLRQRLFDC